MRCLRIPVGAAAYWTVADDDYRLLPMENDYLRHLRFGRDRAESTTKRYAEALAVFAGWRARTGRRDLARALTDLHLYVTWLRLTPIDRPGRSWGRARSGGRINQMLAAVREMAKHAVHTGRLPSDVLAALWEVGDDRNLPDELSPEDGGLQYRAVARHRVRPAIAQEPAAATPAEVAALVGAARSWRDRFLIWLMWTTGLRVGAALGLRRSDMHLTEDARALGCQVCGPHLHVVTRDNPNGAAAKGAAYHVPVRDDLLALYEMYLVERESTLGADGCDFVLVNLLHTPLGAPMTYPVVRQLLAGLSKRSGLARAITPHMLRHGTGRTLVEEGEDISTVQRLLGHRALSSTQIYATPSASSLRAAVDALPPLPSGIRP